MVVIYHGIFVPNEKIVSQVQEVDKVQIKYKAKKEKHGMLHVLYQKPSRYYSCRGWSPHNIKP